MATTTSTSPPRERRADAPRAEAPAPRPVAGRQEPRTQESAIDRFAFYFFMGTITLGILAMVVMSFTI